MNGLYVTMRPKNQYWYGISKYKSIPIPFAFRLNILNLGDFQYVCMYVKNASKGPSHKIDFSKIRLLRILLCITEDEEKNGHLLNDGEVCTIMSTEDLKARTP